MSLAVDATRRRLAVDAWLEVLAERHRGDARPMSWSELALTGERVIERVGPPDDGEPDPADTWHLVRCWAAQRRRDGYTEAEAAEAWPLLGEALLDLDDGLSVEHPERDGGGAELVDLVGSVGWTVGRAVDATCELYRGWEERAWRDRADLLECHGRILVHEIENRLGAAETALMMMSTADEPTGRRRRQIVELCRRALDGAEHSARHLARLVGVGDPSAPLPVRSEIAEDIVRRAVRDFDGEAERRGVQLAFASSGETTRAIPPGPVRVIVRNLVANAIRHGCTGEAPGRVDVSVTTEADGVEILVRDHGPGIDPRRAPGAFDPAPRPPDGEGGAGLGLAVAEEAARGLGARLALEHAPGGGTLCRLSIPLPTGGADGGSSR